MIARNHILAAVWPAPVYLSNFSQSSLYLFNFSCQLCTYPTFPINWSNFSQSPQYLSNFSSFNCVLIQLFKSTLYLFIFSQSSLHLSNFSNKFLTVYLFNFSNHLCTYPTFPINGVLFQLFFNPAFSDHLCTFPIICVLIQLFQSTTQSRDSPTGPHDV